jgi:hypothetical protein
MNITVSQNEVYQTETNGKTLSLQERLITAQNVFFATVKVPGLS